MADGSAIEWTDATWNPVTGCDRVSPGCAHCYALTLAKRLQAMGNQRYQRDGERRSSGPGFGLTMHEDLLDRPLRWRRPRRIFVNSMSDLFHEDVTDEFIAGVFGAMASATQHVFQVLTKRPERARDLLHRPAFVVDVAHRTAPGTLLPIDWPLPNVWLGVSIENRRFLHRAELLRQTPAAVRFISAEPLLGPIAAALELDGLDQIIVGGESGPRHRPMRSEWVRDLRDRCLQADVAFFFKQWGGRTPKAGGRELDGRTWDGEPIGRQVVAAA